VASLRLRRYGLDSLSVMMRWYSGGFVLLKRNLRVWRFPVVPIGRIRPISVAQEDSKCIANYDHSTMGMCQFNSGFFGFRVFSGFPGAMGRLSVPRLLRCPPVRHLFSHRLRDRGDNEFATRCV
jgi:hypothetical protein